VAGIPQDESLKVLIVDDDSEDRTAIREMLADADTRFDARGVSTLEDALQVLTEDTTTPDVVLLDLMLPDSEGLETSQRVKEAKPDVPVVVLTGVRDEEAGLQALQVGAQDYLTKADINSKLLEHAVLYAVERQELESRLKGVLRELDHEFELMAEVQHSLLPTESPDVPGYDLSVHYQAARQAGGDYFDFFQQNEDRLGILLTDVSGHGAAAALLMGMTRVLARGCCRSGTPGDCLSRLNNVLRPHIPRAKFVTACYVLLEINTGTLRFADAAHPPPLHRSGVDNRVMHTTLTPRTPCGVVENEQYPEQQFQMVPGSVVLLYTDGLTEARNRQGDQFSRLRVARALEELPADVTAEQVIDAVLAARRRFTGPGRQEDDTTLVALVREREPEEG
jgi:serine phosphatase RsbU (regulator of sigma subunit)